MKEPWNRMVELSVVALLAVATVWPARADVTPAPKSAAVNSSDIERAHARLQQAWEAFLTDSPEARAGTMRAPGDEEAPTPQRLENARRAATPFRSPVEVRSLNGELRTTLQATYAVNQIGTDPVRLRSYNGALVGPTLRARPGDVLRITLRNDLPLETGGGSAHNGHHRWNTTNLHTHGLHVSPSGNSDNVLLNIGPGEVQEYEIAVPDDHPAGTFWYHAHKHGSVAAQVSSGMSGALIIEGGLDEQTEVAGMRERVMVLQQIPYWNEGLPEGIIELPYVDELFGPRAWDRLGRYTIVNGVQLPVIEMRPGEVQRWRMVHSGFRETLVLKLVRDETGGIGPERLPLQEIAVDGLALGKRVEREQIELWPGNRSDVLVQAPPVGGATYLLVDERTEAMDSLNGIAEPRKYIARVVVDGQQMASRLPDQAVLAQYRLPSISASEVTGQQSAVYGITFPPLTFGIDGSPYDPTRVRQLRLGEVDEWTVRSVNSVGPVHHPFHIHVNPFEVFSILDENGKETLDGPVWRDTVILRSNWTVKFRTRYSRFTGRFVQHCHILDHEDFGMMELVEITR